ncbi:MAG TPA: helix-turn-helix transcriptional regulator [Terriglobales bacterium]|jgi:DNA-binding PadR family transcriptional regulator|nr:helix-turn-helix transcriptional regulator [Terriglobales bacterium]
MKSRAKLSAQVKRGSAELAVLSVLAEGRLHGYEIAKRIGQQTAGVVTFDVASLYPVLYAMESKGWVKGEWEAAPSGRKRRSYTITPEGRKQLEPMRREWREFLKAMTRLTRLADA